jgi:hypothetical protein
MASRTVIVGGPVKAKYAELFGDGRQSPPIERLVELGIAEPVLERVTNWKNDRKLEFNEISSHKLRRISLISWYK